MLLRLLEAATERLARSVDEVNDLNVYPVPDGDTGTNMLHTMRSAARDARAAGQRADEVATAAAHGALMGARGNSGVILSQVIRGLKEAAAGAETIDGERLREAFRRARDLAFAAVTAPAPGTILSSLDAMADAAVGTAGAAAAILREAVGAGVSAVERTRFENPVNAAAGVVDAGARGLWLLLDGALAALEGRPAAEADERAVAVDLAPPARAFAAPPRPADRVHETSAAQPDWRGAYDVQFLVAQPGRSADDLRADMLEFGADCVLVVGDESVVKVHVHTLHPHEIIRIGLTAGRVGDVVVEDLEAMAHEHGAHLADAAGPLPLAVVSVVPGDGVAEVARSLGATPLRGGPTMNPSTEELASAIRSAGARHVIVLPNDKNVILAAEQAARVLSDAGASGPTAATGNAPPMTAPAAASIRVTVVPTRHLGQGMAALVAYEPGREPAEVIDRMREASAGARTLEVTTATRSTNADGQDVRKGEALALLDGAIVAHGDDDIDVLVEAASRLAGAALLTLYRGAHVPEARAAEAAERLRAACSEFEVEVVDGGQPHYPFIVTIE